MLHWLDNWPVGLKLNTELSSFSFATLSAMLDVWEGAVTIACTMFQDGPDFSSFQIASPGSDLPCRLSSPVSERPVYWAYR